jgi:hypothetical protein
MSRVPFRACLLLFITIAAVGGLIGSEPKSLTLDEVIARNTTAMGGRVALEAVQSIEVSLHITDPTFEVDGIYRAARPGRMRIDITADGKRVYTEAFDGEKAWQWDEKNGQRPEGSIPTSALRHGVQLPGNLYGLHELERNGHRLKLEGQEKIDGVELYLLRVTLADGFQTSLFVDPRTWRVTRKREVRALHPDIDPTTTTIETRHSDFRLVGSVWFSFASEDVDLETGKTLESAQVKEIRLNPAIDSAIFTKP